MIQIRWRKWIVTLNRAIQSSSLSFWLEKCPRLLLNLFFYIFRQICWRFQLYVLVVDRRLLSADCNISTADSLRRLDLFLVCHSLHFQISQVNHKSSAHNFWQALTICFSLSSLFVCILTCNCERCLAGYCWKRSEQTTSTSGRSRLSSSRPFGMLTPRYDKWRLLCGRQLIQFRFFYFLIALPWLWDLRLGKLTQG